MTSDVPTIMDGFDELREHAVREDVTEDMLVLSEDPLTIVRIEQGYMDFDIGKQVADLYVEHNEMRLHSFRCREIHVTDHEVFLRNGDEQLSLPLL